jgi:hypothetical protein
MGGIAIRDWRAWEHSYPSLEGARAIIVTGLAQVRPGKMVLEEHAPLQIEQTKTLYLKFAGETGHSWEPVWFQKKIRPGDYTKVQLITPQGHQTELLQVMT